MVAVAAALALAGCGGGESSGGVADGSAAGPATGADDRAQALIVAVCQTELRGVPAVPDEGAGAAERRGYLRAVERATRRLAPDLDRLAAQDTARRAVLTELARRMRAVADVARASAAGRVAAGAENDLATTLAKLNVLATRERLPQCGV